MTDQPTHPTASLTATATLTQDALLFDLRVRNGGDAPVYLLNGLWLWDSADKAYRAPSTPAYAALQDDKRLHLLLGIPPLPKTRRVGQRIVPFATKLEAGGLFEESLQFPLPVREHNPYFPPTNDTRWHEQTAESLAVALHYVGALDGMSKTPSGLEDKLLIQHPRLLAEVQSLRTAPQALAVPVQRQLGDFERF